MKKLLILALAVLVSSSFAAKKYGMAGCGLGSMLIGANGEDDYVLSVIFLLPMLLMLWMTINSASRLQVANGHFTSFGLFGRKRDFEINDIGHAHVSGRGAQRRVTLFDRDGRPLAGCQSSMRGFATLMDYITGHRLPLQ